MRFEKILTPFFGLYAHVATKMYSGTESAQLTRLKQDVPAYYLAAIIADMALRLCVVGLGLFLAVYMALKLVS